MKTNNREKNLSNTFAKINEMLAIRLNLYSILVFEKEIYMMQGRLYY